jgi:transcriptional regulator with XRE-family HTH domain
MATQVDVRKQIADRLKTAREQAGFSSVEAFCKEYHVDCQQYQDQEDGKTAVIASQLIEYSEKLHVSLSYLLLGED